MKYMKKTITLSIVVNANPIPILTMNVRRETTEYKPSQTKSPIRPNLNQDWT